MKRVFFQSAFCAVSTKDPTSKAFYDRKRRERQRHVQALVALAPGRLSVADAHEICDRIERALRAEMEGVLVTIHVEPEEKAKHSGIVVL